MSKLHKTIHKSGITGTGGSNTDSGSNLNTGSNASSDTDFHSMLSIKLSNLSLGDDGSASTSISNAIPIGSPRSPLSRQESRQNSMLSLIIEPDVDVDQDKETRSGTGGNESKQDKNIRKLKLYTIPDLINVLGLSSRVSTRSGVGKREREILFAHLYRMIISASNSDIYMGDIGANDEDFLKLVNLKNVIEESDDLNFNISFDWEAWLRCVVGYTCIGVDDVAGDAVELVFPMLMKTIGQLDSIKTKEDISILEIKKIELSVWAFMAMILFIFFNSENHGMLEHSKLFVKFVQDDLIISDDGIVSSCLYMVALSLTLAWESGRNVEEIIEDYVLECAKVVLAGKKKQSNSKIAAAVLVGVCFEILESKKDDGDEDEDNDFLLDELNTIKEDIEILANEGTKKTGKKGKVAKNIFRQVLDTLNKEETDNEFDIIALSKSKSINVHSWFTYVRVQILRFVLGSELSSWLARSKEIRNMLKRFIKGNNESGYGNTYESDDEDEDDSAFVSGTTPSTAVDSSRRGKDQEKERTKLLMKQRRAKEERRAV